MSHIAVIDFGKTNVKVVLVEPGSLTEIAARRIPNTVRAGPPFAHYDTQGHWDFLIASLRDLNAAHGIAAISITTHGATAALIDEAGALVLPILDYEDPGPEEMRAAYDAIRPAFHETGSPRLGNGLNLGAQLHWLFRRFPETAQVRHILPYPQYWAWRLTGVAAAEPTSLGCHTDLWRPREGRFSSLVERMGWIDRMPPVRPATDRLGVVRPEVADLAGLPPDTPVANGIHDSNASLYPHLLARSSPFAVVSTGTWVVCMAVGAGAVALDPARDTLINVDARGEPVPSARFMGGREYEIVRAGCEARPSAADRAAVLRRGVRLLPSVEAGSGPFAERRAAWTAAPETDGERMLALSWYLALMTAQCLSMIGAAGPVIVEGPFAGNADYLEMIAAATGRPVGCSPAGSTGTSLGAALLVTGSPAQPVARVSAPPAADGALAAYAAAWRHAVADGVPGRPVAAL
ncbi:FGGY-family carbohydrate kinase [Ancylobacter oerskovii]|uniref:FGGY-family carbohydrate kinase n=1 Tax=Ancylobacter oerskovii TaxID=459519 RepID=A0ABW4YW07_9HYPH|nr:FGGY-family carbohydrate kinase [Ancylobacter oerskovii]